MADIKVLDKVIPRIRLIVFDKDGTIIDLFFYWSKMVLLRAEQICRLLNLSDSCYIEKLMNVMGIDLQGKRFKPEGPVGIYSRDVVMKVTADYLAKTGIRDANKICIQAFEEADQYSLISFSDFLKLIPGVEFFINVASRKGIKMAVATSDKTQRAVLMLETLGLKKYFSAVVGCDMGMQGKPAPNVLNYINKIMAVHSGESIIIGDTYHDIEFGKNAKYAAQIILLSQMTERHKLTIMTEYFINDFNDLQII